MYLNACVCVCVCSKLIFHSVSESLQAVRKHKKSQGQKMRDDTEESKFLSLIMYNLSHAFVHTYKYI